jgi:hypothetical protein
VLQAAIEQPFLAHRGLRVGKSGVSQSKGTPQAKRSPRNQKFADSPLEGDGFEPSVPREAASASPGHPEPSRRGSVSKVQPTGIKQVASSSDTSTMRSSPMVICRTEKVWTEPITSGALMRTPASAVSVFRPLCG